MNRPIVVPRHLLSVLRFLVAFYRAYLQFRKRCVCALRRFHHVVYTGIDNLAEANMFDIASGFQFANFIAPGLARAEVRSVAQGALRVLVLGALAALPVAVAAQSGGAYPARTVRMIVPFPPGGAPDVIARHLAPRLTEALGESFIVENRAGAGGNLGVDAVIKSVPDGYTVLVGNVSTNAINESLFASVMSIRPSRDLTGVTMLVEIPHVLAVTPSFPARSVAELVALAKKSPGKINYASAGPGGYPHLDTLRLQKAAAVEMTHVAYKGAGPIMQALITGEIQMAFLNLASGLPQIKAGKLRAIATVTAARLAELPELPTMAEQGYAGIGTNAWQAMFLPVATPAPIVDRLFKTVTGLLSRPEMKDMLAKQMLVVSLSKSPKELTDFVHAETQKWAAVVQENNVRVE